MELERRLLDLTHFFLFGSGKRGGALTEVLGLGEKPKSEESRAIARRLLAD